jgi:hypothetical protein
VTISGMKRGLLHASVVIFLAGCGGGSDESTRTLDGGTYRKELGLTAIIDRVELEEAETRAYVTIRNPGAYKFVFDPQSSVLIVDGERNLLDRPDFPVLIPYAGAGGGETSGVLVFPAVDVDADRYELRFKGTSENAIVGQDGNVEWNVVLEPADGQD